MHPHNRMRLGFWESRSQAASLSRRPVYKPGGLWAELPGPEQPRSAPGTGVGAHLGPGGLADVCLRPPQFPRRTGDNAKGENAGSLLGRRLSPTYGRREELHLPAHFSAAHPGAEAPGANEHVKRRTHNSRDLPESEKKKHTSSPGGNTMKRQSGMSSETPLQKAQKRPPELFPLMPCAEHASMRGAPDGPSPQAARSPGRRHTGLAPHGHHTRPDPGAGKAEGSQSLRSPSSP